MKELGRRPLKTRDKNWPIYITNKLLDCSISPNQISVISVVFAVFAGLSFYYANNNHYFWLIAALFIQLRLICNMLDGMVAVMGGKQSKLGEIYNDLPDRFADVIIILFFGSTVANSDIFYISTLSLIWLAALLAIFTAYIRTLLIAVQAPANYSGPMAKPHRMAIITFASLLCFGNAIANANYINLIVHSTLIILNVGMIITVIIRIKHGVDYLLNK